MRRAHAIFMAGLAAAALAFSSVAAADSLAPGDTVASFSLPSYDGTAHALDQYRDSTAVVVMFIATRCPVSNDYNGRMARLANAYQPRGFQFLGINSNKQEPVEEIAEHAGENSFPFPVLKDERNVVADRFGATRTPEVYVISPQGVVLYHGRIDDSQNAGRVKSRDLKAALDAVLAGQPVPAAETRAFGCTIKRVK